MEEVPLYSDEGSTAANAIRDADPADASPAADATVAKREPLPDSITVEVEPLQASPSVTVVHQKIPAECFTKTFECGAAVAEKHMCCSYMK